MMKDSSWCAIYGIKDRKISLQQGVASACVRARVCVCECVCVCVCVCLCVCVYTRTLC